jgi:hypothetical protein
MHFFCWFTQDVGLQIHEAQLQLACFGEDYSLNIFTEFNRSKIDRHFALNILFRPLFSLFICWFKLNLMLNQLIYQRKLV